MKPLQLIRVLFLLTVFAFATATAGTADAAPQLMVRAHLEPSGPVVAGTQIKLVVDCLTTTWFTEAPDWPLFTVPGAIVSFPEEEAQNLHEVIDGVDWFGVSRAYRIVPQTAQTFDVPSFAITVQPGQMNGPAKVMTPALKFVATVPAGAEGMNPFFPSQKLVASQRVEPSPQHLRVGDEVTRTVTQRAAGTQSMLIPPVNFGEVTGLKRYPKPSATKDIVEDRAGLVAGERTDTVTYVIDHGGKFQLPPVTIEWWNTASQKKEAIVLPAVTISAIAAAEKPLFEIPVDALSRGAAHRIIVVDRIQVLMVCALLLAVFALVWAYPRGVAVWGRARRALAHARQRYAEGPTPAWRALRRALQGGAIQRVIPALYRWMDRSADIDHPARVDAFDPVTAKGIEPLRDALWRHYGDADAADTPALRARAAEEALRRATKATRRKRNEKPVLPPLNPY